MSDVVRFPPLPPLPAPPSTDLDERQRTFRHIAGTLTESITQGGAVATTNVTAGFRASAVDVGQLQDELAHALARFEVEDVRDRWDADLSRWMRRLLLSWVQRCKRVQFELADNGVHVQVETQDDRGYYHYEFDVFPGRKTEP
jgi:hypothetical protein